METETGNTSEKIAKFLKLDIAKVIFILSLTLVIVIVFKITNNFVEQKARTFTEPLLRNDSLMSKEIAQKIEKAAFFEKLHLQYQLLNNLKEQNMEAFVLYFKNYYSFTTFATVFTIFTSILTVLMAKIGWDNLKENPYQKLSLVYCAIVATLFITFSEVYNNKENYTNNMKAFLRYEKLQYDIYSFIETQSFDTGYTNARESWKEARKESIRHKTDSVFVSINSQIEDSRAFFIDISSDKIPTGTTKFPIAVDKVDTL